MKAEDFSKVISSGTAQDNRFLEALDFNYVKIDERSLEDLLVFATGFAKLINFYDLNGQIDGDWSEFLNDETVILAAMAQTEPVKTEARFKQYIYKARLFLNPAKKLHYLRLCFKEIYDIAQLFEFWHTKLKAVEDFTSAQVSVRNEITNAIYGKLSVALGKLKSYDEGAEQAEALGEKIGLDYTSFGLFWGLSEFEPSSAIYEGDTLKEKIDLATESLQQLFQAFYETLLYLKLKSPEYLAQSLQTDIHYPEVALFISFLKLFTIAQGNINNLTRRHLDFYYLSILKQKPKPPVPDTVYLKFLIDDAAQVAQVKQGTGFLAGEDENGNDIVYQADSELQVNRVKINRMDTIFMYNKALNVRGISKTLIGNMLVAGIPLKAPVADITGNIRKKTYATFGEDQTGKGIKEKTMTNATMGFAVASPTLLMREGNREISLGFTFSEQSFPRFKQYIEDIAFTSRTSEKETFIKIFLDAFLISVTSDQGWYQVHKYVVTQDEKNFLLNIRFDLGYTEPAIIGFDDEVHSGRFATELPIVRLLLNSESYVYLYSLLSNMVLEQVTVNTQVKGVKNLQLYNQIGQLNLDTPYYPFGPLPSVGNYLLIGSNEVFQKPLEKLNIHIEWFDLPRHSNGFLGYYDGYGLKIDNTVYEATLSVLDEGRWKPDTLSEQQHVKLFRTVDKNGLNGKLQPDAALHNKTSINTIDIKNIRLPSNYAAIEDKLVYTHTTRRGFIKLELNKPDFAFAHSVYPSVLSEVAIANSKSGFFNSKTKSAKDLRKMPNPPYTPLVKSITLDYASSSIISLKDRSRKTEKSASKGQIFHIHPFGENMVYPDNSRQLTYVLPSYDFEGCLLIGLMGVQPAQTVSFLFEMMDDSTVSSEDDPPVVEWSYLMDNEWYLLAPSKILRDDTNGFLKTGIIMVELPYQLKKGNTIVDPDLYWLRVAVLKNIRVASKTVSVFTQVLTATLSEKSNWEGKYLEKVLPAFTIQRSIDTIEGIQSVVQPLDSFGGMPRESMPKFYTRVAERLRHKDRAIMTWDYERLVLEKFPSIFKATCLPNMTSKNLDSPGSVLIVVTPYYQFAANPSEPTVSSEVLYQVKSYIQQFTSPFVKVEVRNPQYERIRIICNVKFTSGYSYGFYIQKLNEQINRHLSRNIFANQKGIELGGKIYSSDILSFMRTLPYVDFITKFSMVQSARDFTGKYVLIDTAREGVARASLQATKPWSVLVPAHEHQITVLVEKQEEQSMQAGVEYLELGEDFIIE
ncbi:hypothetical protein GXP67_04705 [Rhodocytophaga rosea]|uniref:Uncharacterized protein n=1 Tax=Rhodocytophaga rosea TaxID=2704465 RepID=A0A6C0GDI2_9BACT|nr:baseplate J/gp47 family protein [Rhodocytophaga rosea]QHT66021.1 hypothetical protein GXP67_04705 [Rhodocytophaga rosea]